MGNKTYGGKTNEERANEFYEKINDKFGDVYNFLEEYITSDKKIKVQHKCPDGDWYTWNVSPANLLNGKPNGDCVCPKCSRRDTGLESFKRKVHSKYGSEYVVLGEYKHSEIDILIKHNTINCQHEFLQKPSAFLNKNCLCPVCTPASRGEYLINDILSTNNTIYKRQKIFLDLKYKNHLRFDFAIFEDVKRTKLKYLIEYQGLQHYSPQRFNGISMEKAEAIFKETVIKDKMKVDYCIKNNIKLVIIPYWEYNKIEEIIKSIRI